MCSVISVILNSIQNLSFRNLVLFPNIFETHEPAKHETAHRQASRQVENTIDSLRIRHQHARQLCSSDHRPESRRAGVDDGLWIDGRRIFGDKDLEAIGEDGVGETEEQGSAERLAEHDERHGDGDLGRW